MRLLEVTTAQRIKIRIKPAFDSGRGISGSLWLVSRVSSVAV